MDRELMLQARRTCSAQNLLNALIETARTEMATGTVSAEFVAEVARIAQLRDKLIAAGRED